MGEVIVKIQKEKKDRKKVLTNRDVFGILTKLSRRNSGCRELKKKS